MSSGPSVISGGMGQCKEFELLDAWLEYRTLTVL